MHKYIDITLICTAILAGLLLFSPMGSVFAQPAPAGNVFEAQMRASDATTLVAGKNEIHLWGVESVDMISPGLKLKARTALDNAIGGKQVQCDIKIRPVSGIRAQCINNNDLDLSLFMLQQGYVTADRTAVYGTVFEEAYIQAEMEAQDRGLGIWAEPGGGNSGQSGADGGFMLSLGFILFLFIIGAFSALSIIIMKGFQNVIDAQNQNVEMMSRERQLRDKERGIVAVMLDSELKANKAKIEAYLVVYEEMLSALRNPDRASKYKKSGDIVQKQPALSRSVFDRNTDKIDILGRQLSSEVVHFYARIKSTPDYITLEPDVPLEEAVEIVEEAVQNGQRLNELAEGLIDSFGQSGVISEAMES